MKIMKKFITNVLLYAGTILFFGGITCFAFSENIYAGFTMAGADLLMASLIAIINNSSDKYDKQ